MTTIRFVISFSSRIFLLALFAFAPRFLSAQTDGRKAESEVMPVEKAQGADEDVPSLKLDIHNIQISRRILLEPLAESAKSTLAPGAKDGPLLIGIGREVPSPYSDKVELSALEWIGLNSGGKAAALTVTSPGASALRLGLSVAAISDGIEIRFFNTEIPEKVFGPYTAKELLRENHIQQADPFWSPVMEGDTIGMEIFLPEGRHPDELSFSIPKISHLWMSVLKSAQKRLSDIGSSGSCEVDIACNTQGWGTTGNSVVKYIYTSYPYSYTCTGTLLADTVPGTYIPYFLTANHCVNTQSAASTINTYWFFQRSTCGGPDPTSVTQQTGGATLLAHDTTADYSLLQLNDTPPAGAVFSGWSTGTISPGTSIAAIHHPMGDLKKISLGTANGYAQWLGSVDGTGDYINVTWSSGVVESGSSGSGIWVSSGGSQYLVGTATGGYGIFCSAATEPVWYGRFDIAYDAISQWIDPGLRDLVISSGTPTVAPSSVIPGETVQLSAWTAQNQGAAATGAFNNGFYLSTDATITSSDVYLDGNQNSSLASGASTDWSAQTLTVPTSTAPGSYYFGILADRSDWVTESNESNNYVSVPFTVSPPPGPDLRISSGTLTVAPSFVLPGGTVQLSAWTVKNQGADASAAFENGFYLSTDQTITSSDTYLGGNSNPSLASGASTDWSAQTLTIPANTAPGTYYIGILADRTNTVAEWDENNNYASVSLSVITKAQNGVPYSVSGTLGDQTYYLISVPSGNALLRITTSGGSGDVDLYVKFGSLPTASSYDCRPYLGGNNESCTFTNPSAGNWYVMLNGYDAYSGLTLTATYYSGQTLLQLTNLSGVVNSQHNYSITLPSGVSWLVVSTSGGTGDVDLYVKYGSQPTFFSYDCRPYLNGNNENCILANPSAGDWYISLNGYSNYYLGVTLTATYANPPPPIDLVISSGTPTVTPSSVSPGSTVQLSAWTVQNQGNADSGTFVNGFYLSTDATISSSDTYLDGNSNASLAAGASYSWGAQTLTIPLTTAPGSYYIGILVDHADEVAESNEANNYSSVPLTVTPPSPTRPSSVNLDVSSGGAASSSTGGLNGTTWVGYSTATANSGAVPYGTAVFSFQQNGFTVTEAGVPASPPTTLARVFVDYRSGVLALPGQSNSGNIDINTGIAVVNTGAATTNVTYTLRDTAGTILAFGNGTIAAGTHFAKFISQLTDVAPNFSLPSNFQNTVQFASLEIAGDQPLSVLALRGTNNQRNDFLITTTPIADLTQSVSYAPVYFPQFADGGGYTTSLVLLNASNTTETGTLQILDNNGSPLVVNQVGGTADSSFRYSIPAGGAFHFQTDGSPAGITVGWVRLTPDLYSPTPVGSGMFSYNPGPMLISESGIPSAVSTTHARVYVDLSGDHNTGLAIANVGSTDASITINAFQNNGVTPAGTSRGPLQLTAYGHDAEFADQFITGLPAGFTGVLDISSTTPFTALTMRSLVNERDDFLMTTFPIADANAAAPSPIVFPQVVDGGGYATQVILISSSGAASTTLNYFDEDGSH